jgi:hypothetical protein
MLSYAALVASTLGACAGKLEQPQRFAAAAARFTGGGTGGSTVVSDVGALVPPPCVLEIFKTTCGLTACHAKGSSQVDLVSDGVAGRLIDKKSGSALCKGRTYVATDETSSLLLDKLTDAPPCGARMPLGGMLSAASTQCLTDWVVALGGSGLDAGGAP